MKSIKTLILIFGIAAAATAFGQEMPDSIAVCPAGDPEEMNSPAPEDATASRLMTLEEVAVAADSIVANYDADWSDLSMEGKLSFDGLPMSVGVKVYMKRGEAVILSARAPFLGEVARVEINQDSVTLINKHTRTYNVQPLDGLDVDRKAYLSDLQDILLGQVAFPGYGRLTAENAFLPQWMALASGEALVYPSPELQTQGTEYGFVMDSVDWQLSSFVLMLQKTGVVIETKYLYGDKGWTLGLEINLSKKKLQGEVQLSYPEYDGVAPLEFTRLGGKYRKVDFKQLMKF